MTNALLVSDCSDTSIKSIQLKTILLQRGGGGERGTHISVHLKRHTA